MLHGERQLREPKKVKRFVRRPPGLVMDQELKSESMIEPHVITPEFGGVRDGRSFRQAERRKQAMRGNDRSGSEVKNNCF